jgi:hypothetical protein
LSPLFGTVTGKIRRMRAETAMLMGTGTEAEVSNRYNCAFRSEVSAGGRRRG